MIFENCIFYFWFQITICVSYESSFIFQVTSTSCSKINSTRKLVRVHFSRIAKYYNLLFDELLYCVKNFTVLQNVELMSHWTYLSLIVNQLCDRFGVTFMIRLCKKLTTSLCYHTGFKNPLMLFKRRFYILCDCILVFKATFMKLNVHTLSKELILKPKLCIYVTRHRMAASSL